LFFLLSALTALSEHIFHTWLNISQVIHVITTYLKGELPLSLNIQRKLYLRVKYYAKADYHNFISYFILVLIKWHQNPVVMRNTLYLFLKILWSFKMLFMNKTQYVNERFYVLYFIEIAVLVTPNEISSLWLTGFIYHAI